MHHHGMHNMNIGIVSGRLTTQVDSLLIIVAEPDQPSIMRGTPDKPT